ncbi:hypothetical protein GNX71_11740 [Variovorax sp. RKNM96]|uniref:hypothetical protein n=1 Tax=Variovorax sp. RKNM96 TaxID=2681552 RepID=UPI00197DD349|nr:hypothetical protein [Variovorax sp. RKNM96]QSI30219.1 hypothetical protein GNX71_11740 [Variovorax sp. RKNM96]
MADALTRAITTTLWPFLKSEGFQKVTLRKFVRQRSDVFQQLWVDANGAGGSKRACVVLCASLPFGPVNGYMDPHGFRISNGRIWNMATPDSAAESMTHVIEALRSYELARLDGISSVEKLLDLLEQLPNPAWHSTYSQLHQRWCDKAPEALALERGNRLALKLD